MSSSDGAQSQFPASLGQAVKIAQRQAARARRSLKMNHRIQRDERNAHIGRVCRNAALRSAENGVVPIETFQSITAGIGLTLIAMRGVIIEVPAAGALKNIATHCRHISYLRAGTRQNGARQKWKLRPRCAMRGKRRVLHTRADEKTAICALLDGAG